MGKKLGMFVAQSRSSKGISQSALAKSCTPSVTTQFISNIERGVSSIPGKHIVNVSSALNVSADDLILHMCQDFEDKLRTKVI